MRYRLPDALGGHPVKLIRRSPNPNEMSHVLVELADESFPLLIHLMVLVVVEEPLPEEPPLGTVVLDREGVAWQRVGPAFEQPHEPDGYWWAARDIPDRTWKSLHGMRGPLRLLVKDPFAEPVELPWTGRDESGCEVRVGQSALDDKAAYVDAEDAHLSGEDTRAMARALWAAADAAERAS